MTGPRGDVHRSLRAVIVLTLLHLPAGVHAQVDAAEEEAVALRAHAESVEHTARGQLSVVALQQAIAAWSACLSYAPSGDQALAAQSHIDALTGLVQHLRSRAVLDEARDRRNERRCADALPLYDRYLEQTPRSLDRSAIEMERASCARVAAETRRHDSAGTDLGAALLAVGALAITGGALLLDNAADNAAAATRAPSLAEHDAHAALVAQRTTAATALCVIGGAAMLGGVVRFAIGRYGQDRNALWVRPGAGGVVIGGTF